MPCSPLFTYPSPGHPELPAAMTLDRAPLLHQELQGKLRVGGRHFLLQTAQTSGRRGAFQYL